MGITNQYRRDGAGPGRRICEERSTPADLDLRSMIATEDALASLPAEEENAISPIPGAGLRVRAARARIWPPMSNGGIVFSSIKITPP